MWTFGHKRETAIQYQQQLTRENLGVGALHEVLEKLGQHKVYLNLAETLFLISETLSEEFKPRSSI